jgi:hypothetical protein
MRNFSVQDLQNGFWLITGARELCVVFRWVTQYGNCLDGSVLRVQLYDGPPRLPGLMPTFEEPRRLKETEFDYDLIGPDRHGYVQQGGDRRSFSAEELADHILRTYMDAAEKHGRH